MHNKFLEHSGSGKGSGYRFIQYLLQHLDSNGVERKEVRVLRGDPKLCAELMDSLETVHRYTSGVTAFALEDDPSEEEIQSWINDWERLTFACLNPDQYTYAAILHVDPDGSKHIHFAIPRVELTSGKSLNVAPPGWQSQGFIALRDSWNSEKGWASPADPARARVVQGGNLSKIPTWKKGEDPRQVITRWLANQVEIDAIKSRDDVIKTLNEIGQVTKVVNGSISVILQDTTKPIRLKGLIYGQDWDASAIKSSCAKDRSGPDGRSKPDLEAAGRSRIELERAIAKRAEYNKKRYPYPDRATSGGAKQSPGERGEKRNSDRQNDGHSDKRHASEDGGPLRNTPPNVNQSPKNPLVASDSERDFQRSGDHVDSYMDMDSRAISGSRNEPNGTKFGGKAAAVRRDSTSNLPKKEVLTKGDDDGKRRRPKRISDTGRDWLRRPFKHGFELKRGFELPSLNAGRVTNGLIAKFGTDGNRRASHGAGGSRSDRCDTSGSTRLPIKSFAEIGTLGSLNPENEMRSVPGRSVDEGRQEGPHVFLSGHEHSRLDHERTRRAATNSTRPGGLRRPRNDASEGLDHDGNSSNFGPKTTAKKKAPRSKSAFNPTSFDAGSLVTGGLVAAFFAAAKQSALAARENIIESDYSVRGTSKSVVAAARKIDRDLFNYGRKHMQRLSDDQEIEFFKATISIEDYAKSELGYTEVAGKSTTDCLVLKNEFGTILVGTDDYGYGYWSNGDGKKEGGSIIHLIQKRTPGYSPNLVEVRKILRVWTNTERPASPAPLKVITPKKPKLPLETVQRMWQELPRYNFDGNGHYLPDPKSKGGRALSRDIIGLFDVRIDEQGFGCFQHTNEKGQICGWERKCRPDPVKMAENPKAEKARTTQFLDGGSKRLFITHIEPNDPVKRIVVTESAIDAMSHAQMFMGPREIYVSHGGNPSKEAFAQLKDLLHTHPNAQLFLAHDNDEAGDRMAQRVKDLAPEGMQTMRERPVLKDWSDDLQRIDEMRREEDLLAAQRRQGLGHGGGSPAGSAPSTPTRRKTFGDRFNHVKPNFESPRG